MNFYLLKNYKEEKQLLLKNMLLILNKNRLNKSLNNKEVNKYINELNNKGNKLQHLNNINIWSNQIYNYNKNIEINTIILDKLVSKLLYKLITQKLLKNNNNILKNILISKPIFEHTVNRVNIKFFYYTSLNNNNNKINNYYLNIISKLINLLNNNNNNLSKILSYYYNKQVTIESIKLSYNYLNSDIFSQSINKDINKYNNGIKGQYSRLLNINIPKLNDQIIAKSYINNINNINKLKYNNIINNLNNSSKLSINNIYNSLNIYNIPINILMFKYLTGWSILLNGRLASSKAISRTNTHRILLGTFRNKKYLWGHINNNYKLNYISANHNISNISSVNKNGKYNIKVKLNFI